ncbi:hypothetical protein ANCCAN_04487, partial [Ancylostoma caninum]
MDPNDISRILDKVGDVRAQERSPGGRAADNYQVSAAADPPAADAPAADSPAANLPEEGEEIVQVGEQVIPVTSAGYYYPVASGVPACFTGDTQVETPSGVKRMDELKIGDLVLTAERNS